MTNTLVLGKNGFIAKSLNKYLEINKIKNFNFLSKKQFNLLIPDNVKKINNYLTKDTKIIFISAIAPTKNINDMVSNIHMITNFFNLIKIDKISHFSYISSDAVYSDTKKIITETSDVSPLNYHGLMHLIREKIIQNNIAKNKLCILRPTLIYGKDDTHYGYGPNLFRYLLLNNKKLKLFGNGTEKRDHIHISDVVDCVYKVSDRSHHGIYNLTSGELISFRKIAEIVKYKFNNNDKISFTKRNGVMPHLGYRNLSNKKISKKLNKKFMNFYKGVKYL